MSATANAALLNQGQYTDYMAGQLAIFGAGFQTIDGNNQTLDGTDLFLTGNNDTVFAQDMLGFRSNNDTLVGGDGAWEGVLGNSNTYIVGNASTVWAMGDHETVWTGTDCTVQAHGHDDTIYAHRGSAPSTSVIDPKTGQTFPGPNTVGLGNGGNRVVNVNGAGHSTVQDASGTGDTINLYSGGFGGIGTGTTTVNLVDGEKNNMVFIDGSKAAIQDHVGSGDNLTVAISYGGGDVNVTGFDPGSGMVDLVPSLGFASAQDAFNAVASDGHGGSVLQFANHLGSIDLHGIAPSALHTSNFQIG